MKVAVDEELLSLGALLLEQRVLRRVIKSHRKIRSIGLQVPHEHSYTLSRAELGAVLEPDDAALELAALPERVILVAGDRGKLEAGDPQAHDELWRALFHGRVHQRFEDLLAREELTREVVRDRTNRIGQAEFDEVRSVLEQEDLLLPPVDPIATYVEFVALYLELRHFAPHAVERTFPAVLDTQVVDATIELDLEPLDLLAASRPPRAREAPVIAEPTGDLEPEIAAPTREFIDASARKKAEAARARGNRSRAAILAARAGDLSAAKGDLDALAARLSPVLGGAPVDGWSEALLPVARFAATRRSLRFDAGARLLHDLQAACVIAEREYKVVDVITWMLSRGKQPVIRSLPAVREVRVARRLHAAEAKVATCGLASRAERERLAAVVRIMARHADERLRSGLRPELEAALEKVGMRPSGLPERVGRKKLVDELLDRASDVGRLSLPDLRDAISRNDLKMSNMSLGQLRTGDQLLRSDRILASSLDGVYRRGESYLRLLQKISSVLFGTAIGRVLTLYLLLPLLASFAIVEGLQQMVAPASEYLFGVEPLISTRESLLGGAAFLFLLLHVRRFRSAVVLLMRGIGRLLRFLLLDGPLAIWTHPLTRRLLATRPVRWVIKPAIPALVALLFGAGTLRWVIAGGVYLGFAFALNSRFGRLTEEVVTDWIVRVSSQITSRIIPELVRYTLELFAELLEATERGIYRVDEWLRFRGDQTVVMLVIKGVLGTIWFVIAYFVRLYIVLFVEPTINPIKHFPVVTVAAKIILPFIPAILSGIAGPASQLMGSAIGQSFAAFTVLVLPGLAGFLVWELKENWRLYQATRPKALRPVAIGHHGETMARLLKPGFHSGTIPKLFTKIRRASWRGDERAIVRHEEGLHHAEDAIATFARRQLVSMLNEVPSFQETEIELHHVDIGSNRVRISLACPRVSGDLATIRFEQRAGWLIASLPERGWIDRLSRSRQRIVEVALAGFYKLAAVDLVREQLEHALMTGSDAPPRYDITREGLSVWPGRAFESEVVYDLRKPRPRSRVRGNRPAGEIVDLRGRHAIFGREPILWTIWSATWFGIARGDEPIRIVFGPSLLGGATAAGADS